MAMEDIESWAIQKRWEHNQFVNVEYDPVIGDTEYRLTVKNRSKGPLLYGPDRVIVTKVPTLFLREPHTIQVRFEGYAKLFDGPPRYTFFLKTSKVKWESCSKMIGDWVDSVREQEAFVGSLDITLPALEVVFCDH